MQKNAILLGGPWHGRMVRFLGPCFKCWTKSHRKDVAILHEYLWEYRGGEYLGPSGGTVFGVYQKPKERS